MTPSSSPLSGEREQAQQPKISPSVVLGKALRYTVQTVFVRGSGTTDAEVVVTDVAAAVVTYVVTDIVTEVVTDVITEVITDIVTEVITDIIT